MTLYGDIREGKKFHDVSNKDLQAWLKDNNACGLARKWVDKRSLRQAWIECRKPEWMAWLVSRALGAPVYRVLLAEYYLKTSPAYIRRHVFFADLVDAVSKG